MKQYLHIEFFLWLLVSCTSGNLNPRQLNSADYENKTVRLEVLKKEINCYSEILDAEFQLFNVNGFKAERLTVPGATSLDYKFVVRVDTANISKWTENMVETPLQNQDFKWAHEIIQHRHKNWNKKSKPICFTRDGKKIFLLVFEKEGIIFKRVTDL